MTSTSHPPPVIGKSGNLTVFITPPAAAEPESQVSEFSTPPTSPRAEYSPESPPPTPPAPAPAAPPPAPVDSFPTPPLVRTVSPPLPRPAEKLFRNQPVQVSPSPPPVTSVSAPLRAPELSPCPPPPVQVPPLQFEKASPGPDGSVLALFWDAVARVQEAHASLDEHISRWFGLDQSKYQWALNDYYEKTGQEKDSGKADNRKKQSCELRKV